MHKLTRKALEQYEAALERLINNQPEVVPKGSAINPDTVALEAGKNRGALRMKEGFESLFSRIQKEANKRTAKSRNHLQASKDQIARLKQRVEELEAHNELMMRRYQSMLFQIFEYEQIIEQHGLEAKKSNTVVDLIERMKEQE